MLSYYDTVRTTPGLISYWRFDDAQALNAAVDVGGSGNNLIAVWNGSNTTTSLMPNQQPNGAFGFNGSGDYLHCQPSTSLDFGDEFTLEMWINFNAAPTAQLNSLMGKGAYLDGGGIQLPRWLWRLWRWFIDENGTMSFQVYNHETFWGISAAGLLANTTYHVAVTKNHHEARLYINGAVAWTLNDAPDFGASPGTKLVVGMLDPNDIHANYAYWGVMDEVAIYGRALRAEELLGHYQIGVGKPGKDVQTGAAISTPNILDAQGLYAPKAVQFQLIGSSGLRLYTWPDVANMPRFTRSINDIAGRMSITLPRAWGAVGVGGDAGAGDAPDANQGPQVRNGNQVDMYVIDRDTPAVGRLVYSGIIKEHRTSHPNATTTLTLIPKYSQAKSKWIDENTEFTLTMDPTLMAKYLVDNSWLEGITWDASNPLVGQIITARFTKMNAGSALQVIRGLAGSNWYYEITPTGTLRFNKWNSVTAEHILNSDNYSSVNYVYSEVDSVRRVIVYGAEIKNLEGIVTGRIKGEASKAPVAFSGNDASNPDFVTTNARILDEDTAYRYALTLLQARGEETLDQDILVPDNNADPDFGYDIESLLPGQSVRLNSSQGVYGNSLWNTAVWNTDPWNSVLAGLPEGPLIITKIDYGYKEARVYLTTRPVTVIEELVNVINTQTSQGST